MILKISRIKQKESNRNEIYLNSQESFSLTYKEYVFKFSYSSQKQNKKPDTFWLEFQPNSAYPKSIIYRSAGNALGGGAYLFTGLAGFSGASNSYTTVPIIPVFWIEPWSVFAA